MRLDASALPTASGALDGGNGDQREDRKKTKPKPAPKPNTENKTGAIPKLKTAEQEAKTVSVQKLVFVMCLKTFVCNVYMLHINNFSFYIYTEAMSAASSMILECKGASASPTFITV